MSGENLPPYIIFKGKDTIGSRMWKEFSTEAKRAEHGYPESLYIGVDVLYVVILLLGKLINFKNLKSMSKLLQK
jgi:hypothetical protein